MITYTHKVHLMSGEVILITENQANAIKQAVVSGQEWIPIGEELVNPKSIAKIGVHHATSQERKQTENMIEMELVRNGKQDLVEMKRKLVREKTINHSVEHRRDFMEKVSQGDPSALKAYYNMTDPPKILQNLEDNTRQFYIG